MKKTDQQTSKSKAPKEVLTGRVSAGFTARFRKSIPPGLKFGAALEIDLELWMSASEECKIQAVTGIVIPPKWVRPGAKHREQNRPTDQ